MDKLQFRRSSLKPRFGLRASAIGLGLMLSLAMAGAQAQHDPIHTFMNVLRQKISDILKQAEWAKKQTDDVTELTQLVTKYTSMLRKLENLQSLINLPVGVSLRKVDENTFMVEEACGEAGGGGVGGLVGRLIGVDLRGDIFRQQYNICVSTQQMRNRQFNETVDFLTTTMDSMKAMGQELNTTSARVTNPGDVDGNITQRLNAANKLDAAMGEFERRMIAYDTFIGEQENAMAGTAKVAMRGNAGLLRTVTDAAAMRLALCGGGRCNDGN